MDLGDVVWIWEKRALDLRPEKGLDLGERVLDLGKGLWILVTGLELREGDLDLDRGLD